MHPAVPLFARWTLRFPRRSGCMASQASCPLLQIALLRPFPWTGGSCFRISPRHVLLPAPPWASPGQDPLGLTHFASVTCTASCCPQPLLSCICFVHKQQFMPVPSPVRRNLSFVCRGVLSQSFPFAPCLRPRSCCPLLVFRCHLLPVLCRLAALLSRV